MNEYFTSLNWINVDQHAPIRFDWLIDWLNVWLIDWLIDWTFGWLIERLVDWTFDWLIDLLCLIDLVHVFFAIAIGW